MKIASQFLLLVAVPFCVAIAFATSATYESARLSSEVGRLISDIQRTETLSQELARSNVEQSLQLRRQLDRPDPSFPDAARAINYRLGEKYAEYLKLDIDQRERLTVETIKGLQDELSVVSMHVYEQLRLGNSREAFRRLDRLYQVESRIRTELDTLNSFQVGRLQAAITRLSRTARQGFIAAGLFVAALLFVAGAAMALFRRRLLKPIGDILRTSERMRQGDRSARVPIDRRRDEMGQLTRGFNFMAESLAESYATLERRVEERTRELRETQQQLVQAEKMSATGLLVSGVAHELNNPLAAVMGAVELARMELRAGGDPARADAMLQGMDAQVERCRRIVANLLQFARKSEHARAVFSVNAAVDQVLQLREYELGTRNIAIIRDLDPADPAVRGDREKIQQVVLNLLNNAHDAIREARRPGTIQVRTKAGQESVSIEFCDDGVGFRDVGRAFDPFYTTKPPGKGTGLGLSLCYGIVHEHGGEIAVRNLEPGAQATITLPLAGAGAGAREADDTPVGAAVAAALAVPEPAVAEPAAAEPAGAASDGPVPVASRSPAILVVDDEPPLLRLQAMFLGKNGFAAVTVESGDEAVSYLQDHDVDAIVSDVRMPGARDGIGLYEWVAEHRPDLKARFIFASGDLVGLNLGEFFARTPVAHISKPFRYAEYVKVVQEVVGRGGGAR